MLTGEKAAEAIRRLLSEFHGTFGEWIATRGIETDFHCEYCGGDLLGSLSSYYEMQIDHVIPTARGGPHTFDNMALACKVCNLLKRDFVPNGATREDQVQDARRHVAYLRAEREARLATVLGIVRPGLV